MILTKIGLVVDLTNLEQDDTSVLDVMKVSENMVVASSLSTTAVVCCTSTDECTGSNYNSYRIVDFYNYLAEVLLLLVMMMILEPQITLFIIGGMLLLMLVEPLRI